MSLEARGYRVAEVARGNPPPSMESSSSASLPWLRQGKRSNNGDRKYREPFSPPSWRMDIAMTLLKWALPGSNR